jgi:hypothetical protein
MTHPFAGGHASTPCHRDRRARELDEHYAAHLIRGREPQGVVRDGALFVGGMTSSLRRERVLAMSRSPPAQNGVAAAGVDGVPWWPRAR